MSAFISFLEKIGLIYDPTLSPDFSSGGKPFYVSFEGLGIGQFRLNPVAIDVLNGIRFYGIIITCAIILAYLYVSRWRAKEAGYHPDDILDAVLCVVPSGVIGARLFYVFTCDGYDISKWYAIWDGGLAIYGGIIGGGLALLVVAKVKKMRILRLMDCTAPAVMIAQAIGRWGNFFNGEAFGSATDSFMRMGLARYEGYPQVYVHPTFLYESLWNVLGFVLINIFFKKKKFDGQIVVEYFGWYGLGRFFIELLRQDSLPLKIGTYNLKISSVIGLIFFFLCLVVFILNIIKPKNPALEQSCYFDGAKRLLLMAEEENRRNAEQNGDTSVKEETTEIAEEQDESSSEPSEQNASEDDTPTDTETEPSVAVDENEEKSQENTEQ